MNDERALKAMQRYLDQIVELEGRVGVLVQALRGIEKLAGEGTSTAALAEIYYICRTGGVQEAMSSA